MISILVGSIISGVIIGIFITPTVGFFPGILLSVVIGMFLGLASATFDLP